MVKVWPQFGHGFGKESDMGAARKLEGTGKVAVGNTSLGAARYEMLAITDARGRYADGTITMDGGAIPPLGRITFQPDVGEPFALVVTRIANGTAFVSSDGPMPGL